MVGTIIYKKNRTSLYEGDLVPKDHQTPEDIYNKIQSNSRKVINLVSLPVGIGITIKWLGEDVTELISTGEMSWQFVLFGLVALFIILLLVYVTLGLLIGGTFKFITDRIERKKLPEYKKWAEKNDKKIKVQNKKERALQKEKDRVVKEQQKKKDKVKREQKKEKDRVKKVRENSSGVLKGISSIKVCYWCGAEENYQEFISGQVARKEWLHMNNNGTPNMRYKENPLTIIFDSTYCCTNCKAVNEYRHRSSEEPYEKGKVYVGTLRKKGNTPFNETEFLRNKGTKKKLELPSKVDPTEFLNSENILHKTPTWR